MREMMPFFFGLVSGLLLATPLLLTLMSQVRRLS